MDQEPRVRGTPQAETFEPFSASPTPPVRMTRVESVTDSTAGAQAEPQPRVLAYIPYVVGVLALAAYAAFVLVLQSYVGAGTSETEWLRRIYLFSGVEGIAFAAAGFLFGREVNRGRAEQAEKRAEQAEKRAEQAEKRAEQAEKRAEQAEKRVG